MTPSYPLPNRADVYRISLHRLMLLLWHCVHNQIKITNVRARYQGINSMFVLQLTVS
jgi:hypothetical protein